MESGGTGVAVGSTHLAPGYTVGLVHVRPSLAAVQATSSLRSPPSICTSEVLSQYRFHFHFHSPPSPSPPNRIERRQGSKKCPGSSRELATWNRGKKTIKNRSRSVGETDFIHVVPRVLGGGFQRR
ncbi:unnamed protein product [Musa acuminata subsp. burmannicoides]